MTRSISATEAVVRCTTSRCRIRNPRLDASTLSRFNVVVSLRVERGVSRDVSPAESDCASAVYIFATISVVCSVRACLCVTTRVRVFFV